MEQPMGAPQGAAPEGAQGGDPKEAMAVFENIGNALNQVGKAIMDSAPPEVAAKFAEAQESYQEFLAAFMGGAGKPGAEMPQAPEQAGNPNVQQVR